MKKIILSLLLSISFLAFAENKTNVLFIAVDDLKPELGVYGADYIQTPHIDALAGNGTTFTNAHCQQAVCGPSRASLMTGMRPDFTGVWDLKTRMRDVNPNILAMPEFFQAQGYKTIAVGKIYDPRCVDKSYDKPSWSIPYSESATYTYPEKYGEPGLSYYALEESKEIVHKLEKEAEALGENKHKYVSERFKPSTEKADVEDEAYIDGQIANNAIKYLNELKKSKEPFFLAVGFKRPHLPFAAPTKYWDMYQREDIQLAEYREPVKNGVDIAYHNSGEMQSYTDIPPLASFSDIKTMLLPEEKQKELIHAYYASVSFIDAQVGKIIAELEKTGMDKNTVIVLWGDHGWHLGDHNMWCKHSNFENATRVPLIITAPGYKGGEYKHPAELVDIFPTLCELTNTPQPSQLQGQSLVPAMMNTNVVVKPIAVSQFHRGKRNGYSIRTERFRLTLWFNDDYKTYMPYDEKLLYAGELYDYVNDPLETNNVYGSEHYAKVKTQLMQIFKDYVLIQNEELKYTNANPNKVEGEAPTKAVAKSKGVSLKMFASDKGYKVIARNGAEANFKANENNLNAEIKALGKNPWDLGLVSKEKLNLKAGEEVTISLAYTGAGLKVNLRKEAGKGKMKKLKASKTLKKQTFVLQAEAAGAYDIKIEFLDKGAYEIKNFKAFTKGGDISDASDAPKSLITLGETIAQNWSVIQRKGAKANMAIKDNSLVIDVQQMGERPWDLQMSYKEELALKAGQTLTITMLYQGPEMKLNLGPVAGERIGRKIPACSKPKMVSIEYPIAASGQYPAKLSFMSTGVHTIKDIKTNVK